MSDDRLRRWLSEADRAEPPSEAFAASLRAELDAELGFGPAPAISVVARPSARTAGRRGSRRRRPFDLLLVAAIVALSGAALIGVAGALRDRLTVTPPVHRLVAIRAGNRIRIAIRPDHPQFTITGNSATGFDADVATELAGHLGVAPNLVIEAAGAMLSPASAEAWDVALPSVPSWTIDPTAFVQSRPYYRWPHFLIVPATSTARSFADVAAGPVCAVAGDAGEAWLRGAYGGTSGPPLASAIVSRASDDECLAALTAGTALAAVTAHFSEADITVRSDIRPIGGPQPEPRVAIVAGQATDSDTAELLHAVDDALVAMRADGTLARLSQRRFGGADLTGN